MSDTTTPRDAAYQAALGQLNAAQRRAVEHIDGPVLVVAGPGTGKTQILTLRIAHILQTTDAAPEHILALTFTDSGAQAMRSRLRQYIGADAYRVPMYTFHGFADMLIKHYPDAFPHIVGGTAVTDIEKITYLEQILDSGSYTLLRPVGSPYHHVRSVLQQIATMKREYITPNRLREIIADQESALADTPQYHEKGAHAGKVRGAYTKLEKQLHKNYELVSLYEAYEATLRSARRYDFEDMILSAVAALRENEAMLRELQETYQYVLADEHQDVNESQNQILEQLVSYHERPNIFVVGDEKQAIYRFQGASLANFLYFGDRFSDTTTIDLTENYRSGQQILDAAHSIIETDDASLQPLRIPLHAAAVQSATVSVRTFAHEVTEEQWLVSAIQDALADGVPPSEIAVMLRTNQMVEHVAHLLRSAGIAVNASADSDINRHPLTQQIKALLEAVVHPEREQAITTILHAPYWGIAPADVQRVLMARSRALPLTELIHDQAALEAARVADVAAIQRVGTVLRTLHDMSVTALPHRVLEAALHESGVLAHVHAHDTLEGGRVVRRLYDTVEQHVRSGDMRTVADIVRILQQYEEYNVPLAAPYVQTGETAVQVMTAHKAKGLEFEIVFAPYAHDAMWGSKTRKEQFAVPLSQTTGVGDADDDERRLLYVVLTRAKHTLQLSYAKTNADGKERIMSRFLVPFEASDVVSWPEVEPTDAGVSLAHTIPHDTTSNRAAVFDIDRIRTLLVERGISATSLNNYRSSPWNFFYRNILRWPELPALHMQYGTIVHACLEQSVKQYRTTGALSTAAELAAFLHQALERLPITTAEYTQLHEKALSELTVYHEHLAQQITTVGSAEVEKGVKVQLPTTIPDVPEVPLLGMLDRVDYDKSGAIVRVVDYKTGKPRTRNEIMGETKNSDGSYLMQLRFYAVLLDLEEKHHDGIAYTLSFVQPTQSGTVREETFYITAEEIAETKTYIENVVGELASGSFLDTPCDPEVSDYCELVAQLNAT